LPEIESFAKSETEHKLTTMYRAFRLVGTPYVLARGTPKPQVQILQEAFRKALRDPDFHREFKKLSGFDASPLMPQEQGKATASCRATATWSRFSKNSPAPNRCRRGEAREQGSIVRRASRRLDQHTVRTLRNFAGRSNIRARVPRTRS
jgi:hypothetical protein